MRRGTTYRSLLGKYSASTYPLMDYDNNIYNSVVINHKEIIVDNYRSTHYANGDAINNITIGTNVPNSLTSWTNSGTYPFSTFTSSGADITSAIKSASSYGMCKSNYVYIEGTSTEFGTLYFKFTITLNSGTCPGVVIYKEGSVHSFQTFSFSGNQEYTIGVLISENANYAVGFYNTNLAQTAPVDTDFSITGGQVYVNYVNSWASDTVGAYCWYNNDIVYKTPYGALYNYYAIINASGFVYFKRNGSQQTGWRVMSSTDWQNLIDFVGNDATAGGILKEVGLTHWTDPNTDAIDSIGFKGLPGGIRAYTGAFSMIQDVGAWWTGTEYDTSNAIDKYMRYSHADVGSANNNKRNGYSIRCIRDL